MAKTDYRKKQVKRIIESYQELDDNQKTEVMDAIKYNYALEAAKQINKTKTVTFGDMYGIAQERQKFFNKYEGFGSGLRYFDEATMGFRGGEVTIIAGPSGYGKTMMSMNIVANVVAKTLKKCVMISMEMTPEEIATRLYNMVDDHKPLMDNFIIQTELSVSTEHVKAIIEKHKPDIVLIDHLQFLANQEPGFQEYERINSAIAKVKRIAINSNLPIVLISHVAKTRSGEEGEATAADLHGSSAIEKDSDIIIMINRAKSLPDNQLVCMLCKHRTKKPELYLEKCVLTVSGVRTDGSYRLYSK